MEIASVSQLPDGYQLLRVEVDDDVSVAEIADADVPDDWRQNPDWSRGAGTEWLQTETSAVLKVPSAVVPFAHNFLFNPAHPAADTVRIVDALHVKHDDRILKLLARG
jgi:RES domain-containing protein